MLNREIKVKNLTGLVKELTFQQSGNPILTKQKVRDTLFLWTLGEDVREFLKQDNSPTVCMDHEVESNGTVTRVVFCGSAVTLTVVEA